MGPRLSPEAPDPRPTPTRQAPAHPSTPQRPTRPRTNTAAARHQHTKHPFGTSHLVEFSRIEYDIYRPDRSLGGPTPRRRSGVASAGGSSRTDTLDTPGEANHHEPGTRPHGVSTSTRPPSGSLTALGPTEGRKLLIAFTFSRGLTASVVAEDLSIFLDWRRWVRKWIPTT